MDTSNRIPEHPAKSSISHSSLYDHSISRLSSNGRELSVTKLSANARDVITQAKYKSDKWPRLAQLLGKVMYLCNRAFKVLDEDNKVSYVRKDRLIKSLFVDPRIQQSQMVAQAFDKTAKLMTYDGAIWHSVLESLVIYTADSEIAAPSEKTISESLSRYHEQEINKVHDQFEIYDYEQLGVDPTQDTINNAKELLRSIIYNPEVLATLDFNHLEETLNRMKVYLGTDMSIVHDVNVIYKLIGDHQIENIIVKIPKTLRETLNRVNEIVKKNDEHPDSKIDTSEHTEKILGGLKFMLEHQRFLHLLDPKVYVLFYDIYNGFGFNLEEQPNASDIQQNIEALFQTNGFIKLIEETNARLERDKAALLPSSTYNEIEELLIREDRLLGLVSLRSQHVKNDQKNLEFGIASLARCDELVQKICEDGVKVSLLKPTLKDQISEPITEDGKLTGRFNVKQYAGIFGKQGDYRLVGSVIINALKTHLGNK